MRLKGLLKRAVDRIGGAEASPATPASPSTSTATDAAFQTAFRLHQSGRLDEAATGYSAILERDDRHFNALHMLGVLAFQQGDLPTATMHLRRAVAIDPSNANAHVNFGAALRAADRLGEAEQAFIEAARLSPGWSPPYNSLGFLHLARGDAHSAVDCFRRASQFDAGDIEAMLNLGSALAACNRIEEAEMTLRKAAESRPELAEIHYRLGGVLHARSKDDEAERCFAEALALEPNFADASNSLGNLQQSRGRLLEAEASYRRALTANPDFPAALANLGNVLRIGGRLDEAERACRRALAVSSDHVDALNVLALVHTQRGEIEDAKRCLSTLLASDPSSALALTNLGTLLGAEGDRQAAERCYRDALRHNPASATTKYNLATLQLMQGHFEEGFRLYESRFECFAAEMARSSGLYRHLDPATRWLSGDLTAKRVLVWTEQGLGDSLMMMRYLPVLRDRGARRVVVQCQPALERCMLAMDGVDDVIVTAEPPPHDDYDLHVPIMSLPFMFGTRRESVPAQMPYLVVPEQMVDQWSVRLAPRRGLRVGVTWAGSNSLRDDARRNVPLAALAPLLKTEGVEFFSLQKDRQTAPSPGPIPGLRDYMSSCQDLLDTAALISNVDLVISVDTAVVHLAGAIGTPVWLLNRFGSEWRWGVDGEASPWYPSMRIFRQTVRDDWSMTLREVGDALVRWCGAS